MLPEFELVDRLRPVRLVAELSEQSLGAGTHPLPRPAPYAAATAPVDTEVSGRSEVAFELGGHRFTAWVDPGTRRTGIDVAGPDGLQKVRSRRHGRIRRGTRIEQLAVTLTGQHVAALTMAPDGSWTTRARIDLRDVAPGLDPHDPDLLAGLRVTGPEGLHAGGFGQLGLRDLRWVTSRDGTPVRSDGRLLLSATHAGPGFFDTGHTGIWSFDPSNHDLTHRADLFFARPHAVGVHRGTPGVFGDHATHVVRAGEKWLVATSSWSDFDLSDPHVEVLLASTEDDVTRGEHVLTADAWPLPTEGLASRGVWDPHLVHDGSRWLVAYVSAQEFFRFHPVLAAGEDLTHLELLGADTSRLECEGVTLAAPGFGEDWLLLASDGEKARRGMRQRYPVFDLAVDQVGTLEAPHPSNIPWPNVAADGDEWLMVTFDGTPAGGPGAGYGTHGDVLVMRGRRR